MYKEIFPIRIKEIRKEIGYTQRQVENETGIPQNVISKYENGMLEPDLEKLAQLAQFYNVSINWLLGVSLEPEIKPERKNA